jgi:asparagine synthase (glutamine-hydrolysing)
MLWIESYRKLPASIRKGIDTVATPLFPAGSRLRKFLELASLPLERRYRGVSLLPGSSINGLFADGFPNAHLDPLEEVWERTLDGNRGWGVLNRLLYADTKTWLVDDILVKADKMTMANSLELRTPFLDYRIVEMAASMPENMKINGNEQKHILKKVVANKVPREIIRRKKMGFPTPIAIMFRHDLNGYMKEILLDRRTLCRGYFSRRGIEKAIAEHERGIDRSQLLWRLLVLEEWHRVFVDRQGN